MKIGENIKALRKARGFTQEQLADMLGLSFQAVSKWETNVNTPDISLLPAIAKVLGTSIDQLFSKSNPELWEGAELIKDDDVIRIVQFQGHRVLKTTPVNQSFPIIFPRDCNNETQYFKVEVLDMSSQTVPSTGMWSAMGILIAQTSTVSARFRYQEIFPPTGSI